MLLKLNQTSILYLDTPHRQAFGACFKEMFVHVFHLKFTQVDAQGEFLWISLKRPSVWDSKQVLTIHPRGFPPANPKPRPDYENGNKCPIFRGGGLHSTVDHSTPGTWLVDDKPRPWDSQLGCAHLTLAQLSSTNARFRVVSAAHKESELEIRPDLDAMYGMDSVDLLLDGPGSGPSSTHSGDLFLYDDDSSSESALSCGSDHEPTSGSAGSGGGGVTVGGRRRRTKCRHQQVQQRQVTFK